MAPISPDDPTRIAASEAIDASIVRSVMLRDVVESNPDYFGPAALNRSWRC